MYLFRRDLRLSDDLATSCLYVLPAAHFRQTGSVHTVQHSAGSVKRKTPAAPAFRTVFRGGGSTFATDTYSNLDDPKNLQKTLRQAPRRPPNRTLKRPEKRIIRTMPSAAVGHAAIPLRVEFRGDAPVTGGE